MRRSSSSKPRSTGPSTLAARDNQAGEIAKRVVRWCREDAATKTAKGRLAALERLGTELRTMADRYQEADRRHQGYAVDALATADAPTLLERLRQAPSDAQRDRVVKAALRWLMMPAQRVRVDPAGVPVVLSLFGTDRLVGHREGRVLYVGISEALSWPRSENFEPFVGPELPPEGDGDDDGENRCWCHRLHHCPKLEPCPGKCGRLTRGYRNMCRFCAWATSAQRA